MIKVYGWVARWRLAVLLAVLLVAVVAEVLLEFVIEDEGVWMATLAGEVGLAVLLLLAALGAARRYHPATLVVRPEVPALETPGNPIIVLVTAAFTIWIVTVGSSSIEDIVEEPGEWFLPVWVLVISVVLAVFFWIAALGGLVVRLRPDGIVNRQVFGALFVPWEALETPSPASAAHPHWVGLRLARPEQVRRRGFRAGVPVVLPAMGVSAELLARAVHEYANRPDLRPALGTRAELERFEAIPQIAELRSRESV